MKNKLDYTDIPSRWIRVDGLNIHYKCLGKGPPLILIHGGGNDWHEWQKNIAFLAASFQVCALDFPGFGLSETPAAGFSRPWTVHFMKHFMDNLGIDRADLIGHSMGAVIAISLAAQYPECVNRLVLVDAGGLGKFSPPVRLVVSAFRTIDHYLGKKRGPKYMDGSKEEDWLILDELAKIQSPALIVWGQNDIYLPLSKARLAHSLIVDSQLCVFPHCGHAPQREHSVKFNNLILQFLAG